MSQVITFEEFTPPPRYDSKPWTSVRIEEGATADGPWTVIDTIVLDPVDADPTNPAPRAFTTELATDTPALWYRVVFLDATGDDTLPTEPIQNVTPTIPYATVAELRRILKIRSPTVEQTAAMNRVLAAAAGEIDTEIDRAATDDPLAGWQLALVAEVNLERAVEHWQQQESPFGIIGLGAEIGATVTARDSWTRHALKLQPLKTQWGLA